MYIFVCVHACIRVYYSFFSPLPTHYATREEAWERKGHILPPWGIDCKFWLYIPRGCLWRFTGTSSPPPTPCCHPASLRQAPPSHPFLPTPLLLCGYAAVHTTPGLFGPAQQPQAGFISKNSLLTTSTHSRACGLPKLKVLYRWYLNKAGTHLYFLDHKDPHFDLQSILSLWFSKHSLALSYLF